MRVLVLGNNFVASEIVTWLAAQQTELCGLVLHPPERRKFGEDIVAVTGLGTDRVFDGSKLNEHSVLAAIRDLEPDLAVSIFFGYILRKEFLAIFPQGCVNLHPALLPYNRGSYPNIWSIIDRTPAGVTIHFIDEGVDTGDIVAQIEVPVFTSDTGELLYRRLESSAIDLFQQTWPQIIAGQAHGHKQAIGAGTYHERTDVERIDEIDPARKYVAQDLIDIIRARTFPPYRGAYVRDEAGRKTYLRLQLLDEGDFEEELTDE